MIETVILAVLMVLLVFVGWFGIGLGLTGSLSFALSPDPGWLAKGTGCQAKRAGVAKHAVLWPWVLGRCKEAEGHIYGHWCRFVDYPDGHYTEDMVVAMSVAARWSEEVFR